MMGYQPSSTEPPIPETRPNVILISIDTLRADHLSMYGYPEATSPRLDAWARRHAALFTDAVVQAPWTLPSHVSMFTGLDATRHGVNFSDTVVPAARDLLAERLQRAGYSTAAATGGGFLHPSYGLAQGFDQFHYWPTVGEPEGELEASVERALEWLGTLPRPFFLFLHTFEVHDYPIYRRQAGIEETEEDVTWYDQRIRHADQLIGQLLERVEALGLRGETVIVLTSDHGEGFEDRDRGHGHLSESNLLVPLVVELPDGRGAGTTIDRQVRSIDVPATILDLAGLDPWPDADGVSLLPLIAEEPAAVPDLASSYAASRLQGLALRRGGRWKYVLPNSAWRDHAEAGRMYDLDLDPDERRDLAGHPQSRALRRQALRMLDDVPGYRLRFANATDQALHFRLQGKMIGEATVTALMLPCPCVRRERPNEALVEVPPATSFELRLEEVVEDLLTVEAWSGEAEGPAEQIESLQLVPAETPWAMSFDGDGWHFAGSVDAPAETGLTVTWKEGLEAADSVPGDVDPDLRRRLQALGYLD